VLLVRFRSIQRRRVFHYSNRPRNLTSRHWKIHTQEGYPREKEIVVMLLLHPTTNDTPEVSSKETRPVSPQQPSLFANNGIADL
jgi:hypothetical protein